MRLLDRLADRFRGQGYYEGMASGAAVLMTYGSDSRREKSIETLVAATQQMYETNGVFFAVVLARMMLMSEATFAFRSLVDKSLYGTEDLRILEYPWPNGTAGELWCRMEQDDSLAGGAFLWKAAPDLLVRLPPAEVTIVSEIVTAVNGGTYRRPVGYDWDPTLSGSGTGSATPGYPELKGQLFNVDEIVHWSPLPDPLANFRGMSWCQPILKELYADNGLTFYKTQYLDHGTPISAVKYNAKLQPATADSIVDRLQEKFGGAANAWKTLVFDQGADPIMGAGLKDLDFRAIQAGGEARICAAGGVDPIIIGLRSQEPGMTYQAAVRRFGDLTVRPLWRSACAALQKFVPNMPPKGVQLWFDTSDIAALMAAETERAQVTQVSAAATLTFVQAGFKRDSVIAAVSSGDLSQLVADPDAPTPGVVERETITSPVPFGTDPASVKVTDANTRPPRTGSPPGGGQTLTQPQTGASKKPMPASFPTPATAAPNGKGH